ncbi:hypothetical protein GUJ93_ZPchr0003g16570 [Zizania palustris]|uniref:Neprosin activation peptide domain-containing protein n=1 Tax=Zizania palustris TaxID=103762 RepID=A0A8J5RX25_ZIZPA|nr:hypothetical protein GUJ93_ZPchr0003g16570 [Zizania palustris]
MVVGAVVTSPLVTLPHPFSLLLSHSSRPDHPFLKNHTIQMRPDYHPDGMYDDDDSKSETTSGTGGERPMVQLWHHGCRCPDGLRTRGRSAAAEGAL